jgi:hypothetical protein
MLLRRDENCLNSSRLSVKSTSMKSAYRAEFIYVWWRATVDEDGHYSFAVPL